jgi:hypothetical protein
MPNDTEKEAKNRWEKVKNKYIDEALEKQAQDEYLQREKNREMQLQEELAKARTISTPQGEQSVEVELKKLVQDALQRGSESYADMRQQIASLMTIYMLFAKEIHASKLELKMDITKYKQEKRAEFDKNYPKLSAIGTGLYGVAHLATHPFDTIWNKVERSYDKWTSGQLLLPELHYLVGYDKAQGGLLINVDHRLLPIDKNTQKDIKEMAKNWLIHECGCQPVPNTEFEFTHNGVELNGVTFDQLVKNHPFDKYLKDLGGHEMKMVSDGPSLSK